jgi:hypothetical protein
MRSVAINSSSRNGVRISSSALVATDCGPGACGRCSIGFHGKPDSEDLKTSPGLVSMTFGTIPRP